LPHARQREPIAARQFRGAVTEKAAAPTAPGNDLVDKPARERGEHLAHRQSLAEDSGKIGCAALDGAGNRPQQQITLAAECRVKARPAQPGDGAKLVERGALVAFAPERVERAVHRGINVELARTRHQTGNHSIFDYGLYSP